MSKKQTYKTYSKRIKALGKEFDAAEQRYAEIRNLHEHTVTVEGHGLTQDEKAMRASARADVEVIATRMTELRDDYRKAHPSAKPLTKKQVRKSVIDVLNRNANVFAEVAREEAIKVVNEFDAQFAVPVSDHG